MVNNTKTAQPSHPALSLFGRRKYETLISSFQRQSKTDHSSRMQPLEYLLRSNGLCPTMAQISSAEQEISKSGGSCSLNQFLDIACGCEAISRNTGMTDLLEFFGGFDPMNQGYIHPKIFRQLMTNCGERFSESQIDDIIDGFSDSSAGNMINYRRFITCITSI